MSYLEQEWLAMKTALVLLSVKPWVLAFEISVQVKETSDGQNYSWRDCYRQCTTPQKNFSMCSPSVTHSL